MTEELETTFLNSPSDVQGPSNRYRRRSIIGKNRGSRHDMLMKVSQKLRNHAAMQQAKGKVKYSDLKKETSSVPRENSKKKPREVTKTLTGKKKEMKPLSSRDSTSVSSKSSSRTDGFSNRKPRQSFGTTTKKPELLSILRKQDNHHQSEDRVKRKPAQVSGFEKHVEVLPRKPKLAQNEEHSQTLTRVFQPVKIVDPGKGRRKSSKYIRKIDSTATFVKGALSSGKSSSDLSSTNSTATVVKGFRLSGKSSSDVTNVKSTATVVKKWHPPRKSSSDISRVNSTATVVKVGNRKGFASKRDSLIQKNVNASNIKLPQKTFSNEKDTAERRTRLEKLKFFGMSKRDGGRGLQILPLSPTPSLETNSAPIPTPNTMSPPKNEDEEIRDAESDAFFDKNAKFRALLPGILTGEFPKYLMEDKRIAALKDRFDKVRLRRTSKMSQ